jgi:hypothetical protein
MNNNGKMTFFLCCLLLLGSILTPISVEFNKAAEYHYAPDKIRIYACLISGFLAGIFTVIAFLNKSYARYSDSRDANLKSKELNKDKIKE